MAVPLLFVIELEPSAAFLVEDEHGVEFPASFRYESLKADPSVGQETARVRVGEGLARDGGE